MLAAMDRAETLAGPITVSGLSQEDAQLAQNLSFLLAQVLSGRPLNGLEAWRMLVRAEQPVPCNPSCSTSSLQVLTSWKRN